MISNAQIQTSRNSIQIFNMKNMAKIFLLRFIVQGKAEIKN